MNKVYLIECGNCYESNSTDSIHISIESARIQVEQLILERSDEYIQSPDDGDTWVEKICHQDYISINEFDVENLIIKNEEDVCYNRGEIDALREALEKYKGL